jgi:acetyl esterase/lipase
MALRERVTGMLAARVASMADITTVTRKNHSATAPDGHTINIAEFRSTTHPASGEPTSAVYYIHGGGMILGSVDLFSTAIQVRVRDTGVPTYAVSYRLAPEHPDPTPVTDCWTGLQWLSSNAASLGIDPAKIIIMGDSAGGGLAAGTALLARDQKLNPPLLKQILIYPMLDDTNIEPIPGIEPFASWTSGYNITGWTALLGSKRGSQDVSPYAAPARAQDVSGLPATYIECGNLDIFVSEDVEYAGRLIKAGVQVELHIYPGQIHGFMVYAPEASYSKLAVENVNRAILNA